MLDRSSLLPDKPYRLLFIWDLLAGGTIDSLPLHQDVQAAEYATGTRGAQNPHMRLGVIKIPTCSIATGSPTSRRK